MAKALLFWNKFLIFMSSTVKKAFRHLENNFDNDSGLL